MKSMKDDVIRTRMKSTRQRNPNLKVPGGTVGWVCLMPIQRVSWSRE